MQLSYAVGVDGLTLSSKPSAVIALDGLKPYYCNKFSSETFNVISVWLLLCYKSFEVLYGVSITDPGMTPEHRDLTI